MNGFVKESREYLPEEKREADVVQYRRAGVRDGDTNPVAQGWRKTLLPADVAAKFRGDLWHTGGEDYPIHTVVVDRNSGQVLDTVRRRQRVYHEEPEEVQL